MKLNSINVNTPLNGVSSAAVQNSAQNIEHANSAIPAFKGKVHEIKNDKLIKKIKWAGDDFNSAQQRFVSGATGVLLQPWFDLNNKRVDEDTRKVSTARILAKIIVGTFTGVLIRWGLIKAAEGFTKTAATEVRRVAKARLKHKNVDGPDTEFTKKQQWLLPEKLKDPLKPAKFRDIRKYRNTFGTVAAVGVMLFTNFLVDAPLTTIFTNKFTKMITGKDPSELSKNQKGGK